MGQIMKKSESTALPKKARRLLEDELKI
jgi:Asp-tRNA(Asn)/Glu-tRNA(Gln) amidotransferase B subunit